jgi:hypothetical protein
LYFFLKTLFYPLSFFAIIIVLYSLSTKNYNTQFWRSSLNKHFSIWWKQMNKETFGSSSYCQNYYYLPAVLCRCMCSHSSHDKMKPLFTPKVYWRLNNILIHVYNKAIAFCYHGNIKTVWW